MNGSPGQTRTADRVVNSHLLYQLSYRGTGGRILIAPTVQVKACGRVCADVSRPVRL